MICSDNLFEAYCPRSPIQMRAARLRGGDTFFVTYIDAPRATKLLMRLLLRRGWDTDAEKPGTQISKLQMAEVSSYNLDTVFWKEPLRYCRVEISKVPTMESLRGPPHHLCVILVDPYIFLKHSSVPLLLPPTTPGPRKVPPLIKPNYH